MASAGGDRCPGLWSSPSRHDSQAALSVWMGITKAKILLHLFLSEVSIQSLSVFSFKRLGPWQPQCKAVLSLLPQLCATLWRGKALINLHGEPTNGSDAKTLGQW